MAVALKQPNLRKNPGGSLSDLAIGPVEPFHRTPSSTALRLPTVATIRSYSTASTETESSTPS